MFGGEKIRTSNDRVGNIIYYRDEKLGTSCDAKTEKAHFFEHIS